MRARLMDTVVGATIGVAGRGLPAQSAGSRSGRRRTAEGAPGCAAWRTGLTFLRYCRVNRRRERALCFETRTRKFDVPFAELDALMHAGVVTKRAGLARRVATRRLLGLTSTPPERLHALQRYCPQYAFVNASARN